MKQAQVVKQTELPLLQRRRGPGGGVPRSTQGMSNHTRLRVGNQILQSKLAIGAPNDAYEQEADRVAEQVMRMPDSQVLQRKCTECEEEDKKAALLQRKNSPSSGRGGGWGVESSAEAPPIVHEVLRSPGQPLARATRAFMEPRFGVDFGHVRVHTDAKAAESARAVGALAYTVGRDVVMGSRWRPDIMAHELTHVVQGDKIVRRNIDDIPNPMDGQASPSQEGQGTSSSTKQEATPSWIPAVTATPDPAVGIRQWLEQHQFAPPTEQPSEGERHVLLNGEDMEISDAIRLVADTLHQPAEIVTRVVNLALAQLMPVSVRGATDVGPGNLVPALPLAPITHDDNLKLVDHWLDTHGFTSPEIRDPTGDRAVLDHNDTTIERVADQVMDMLGPQTILTRQEVLVHLRQNYVKARGGPGNQVVLGYGLVPRQLQAVTPADPHNPPITQHQFTFTITRASHANDVWGSESSLVGGVTFDDTGEIANVQAGGQEAIVMPLLRGWIQVSGLAQGMLIVNHNQPNAFQVAAGGQVLVTPNFREGLLHFINGHVQFGVQALGSVQFSSSGVSAGFSSGVVVNFPFNLP